MGPERSQADINQNQSKEVKRPFNQMKKSDGWGFEYTYKESQKCWNLAQRAKLTNLESI